MSHFCTELVMPIGADSDPAVAPVALGLAGGDEGVGGPLHGRQGINEAGGVSSITARLDHNVLY